MTFSTAAAPLQTPRYGCRLLFQKCDEFVQRCSAGRRHLGAAIHVLSAFGYGLGTGQFWVPVRRTVARSGVQFADFFCFFLDSGLLEGLACWKCIGLAGLVANLGVRQMVPG